MMFKNKQKVMSNNLDLNASSPCMGCVALDDFLNLPEFLFFHL